MRFIYTKAFAIFAACVLALTVLVVMQVKGWLDPVRIAVLESPRPLVLLIDEIVVPAKDFFGTLYQLQNIARENGQLRSQVISLQQNLAQYQEEARENEALRKELGFVKNTSMTLVPCTVLSDNPFSAVDSLILNCGADDGVSEGQAVISQGYLVGKVTYSGSRSSTVLLAVSSDFSTDAAISQTGVNAIASGSFGSGMILDQVPQSAELSEGDMVMTAGINQQIPKGILIGQVSDILSSPSDLFKRATLLSMVDLNNLSFVFVVRQ